MTKAYEVFVALDGTALEGGQIFIGRPYDDPEQAPIALFWDEALTIPAAQPLRTSGGVIVDGGSPREVHAAETSYSLRVRDRSGRLVWYKAIAGGSLPSSRVTFPIPEGPPGPPGSAGEGYRTRADLADVAAIEGDDAYLTEAGREGKFVFRTGDYSAKVTADPLQGLYIAGIGGTWVRQYDGAVRPEWFGAVGDNVHDDRPALLAAIASVRTNIVFENGNGFVQVGGPRISLGPKRYFLNGQIDLKSACLIEGCGGGFEGGHSTKVRFPPSSHGFIIERYNTINGSTVEPKPNWSGGADGTVLRDFAIEGGFGSFGHGIWAKARFKAENINVRDFAGNGFNVVAASGAGGAVEGNVNSFVIQGGASYSNGGDGLYVSGADANAGNVEHLDCSFNGGWGTRDNSFLGNTYTGCHTALNGAGAYTTNNNARSAFINCYSESGQPTSQFCLSGGHPRGLHEAGVAGTGLWIKNFFGALQADGGFYSDNGASSVRINFSGYFQEMVSRATPLGHQWQISADDLRLTYGGGDAAESIRITGPSTSRTFGRSVA